MKHPTPESLLPLLNAVDVACWCLAVKANTKKGQRCWVDYKSALVDLQEAWGAYQLTHSEQVMMLPEETLSADAIKKMNELASVIAGPGADVCFKDGFNAGYETAKAEAEVLVKALEEFEQNIKGWDKFRNEDGSYNDSRAWVHSILIEALAKYRGES